MPPMFFHLPVRIHLLLKTDFLLSQNSTKKYHRSIHSRAISIHKVLVHLHRFPKIAATLPKEILRRKAPLSVALHMFSHSLLSHTSQAFLSLSNNNYSHISMSMDLTRTFALQFHYYIIPYTADSYIVGRLPDHMLPEPVVHTRCRSMDAMVLALAFAVDAGVSAFALAFAVDGMLKPQLHTQDSYNTSIAYFECFANMPILRFAPIPS